MLYEYVFPLGVISWPSIVTLVTALLSLTVALNVTVCDGELVVNTTVLSVTEKPLILGLLLSYLFIVYVILEVLTLPAVSDTVTVSVCVCEP